jgi:hypothetical protein
MLTRQVPCTGRPDPTGLVPGTSPVSFRPGQDGTGHLRAPQGRPLGRLLRRPTWLVATGPVPGTGPGRPSRVH